MCRSTRPRVRGHVGEGRQAVEKFSGFGSRQRTQGLLGQPFPAYGHRVTAGQQQLAALRGPYEHQQHTLGGGSRKSPPPTTRLSSKLSSTRRTRCPASSSCSLTSRDLVRQVTAQQDLAEAVERSMRMPRSWAPILRGQFAQAPPPHHCHSGPASLGQPRHHQLPARVLLPTPPRPHSSTPALRPCSAQDADRHGAPA